MEVPRGEPASGPAQAWALILSPKAEVEVELRKTNSRASEVAETSGLGR